MTRTQQPAKFPAGHPFAAPEGRSIAELVDDVLAWNATRFGRDHFRMEETAAEKEAREKAEREAAGGGGDGDDDPDAEVTIEGRVWKIKDLQRLAADEKRQGKRSGRTEVITELGVTDVDEAKRLIAAAKKAQADQETAAETAAREAKEARAQADREKAEAAKERRTASLERALTRRGVDEEDLDDAVTVLAAKVADDADAEAIADAADKLKERHPEWFGDGTTAPRRIPAGEIPPGRPRDRNRPKGEKFGEGGLARARKRFGEDAVKA